MQFTDKQIAEVIREMPDASDQDIAAELKRRATSQPQERGLFQKLTEPLTTLPSQIASKVAGAIDQRSLNDDTSYGTVPNWVPLVGGQDINRGFLKGLAGGSIQGAGDVASQLTSPLDLAATAAGVGGFAAAKRGMTGVANAAKQIERASMTPFVAQGASEIAQGAAEGDMGRVGAGAMLTGAGGVGMKLAGVGNPLPQAGQALPANPVPAMGAQPGMADHRNSGLAFKNFFSDVTKGAEQYRPQAEWTPLLEHADSTFMDEFSKHTGNFDNHIATSIPAFRDVQIRKGQAIAKTFGQGARMLDIGASEGSFAKAISALSGGRIQSVALDPNPDMANFFRTKSQVPGAEYLEEAFHQGFDDAGRVYAAHNPAEPYDIIHESMAFQFISPDRAAQVGEAKRLMQPDGVFITEQKVLADPDTWARNEQLKDTKFKNSYYSPDALAAKQKVVKFNQDPAETQAVGMVDNMVQATDLEDILSQNFQHVIQYYDGGNFKGYAASDDLGKLLGFAHHVGDTRTEFSTALTPRMVTRPQRMVDEVEPFAPQARPELPTAGVNPNEGYDLNVAQQRTAAAQQALAAESPVAAAHPDAPPVTQMKGAPAEFHAVERGFDDPRVFADPQKSPLVSGEPYAILASQDSTGLGLTPAQEAKRLTQLEQIIRERGYTPIRQQGVYRGTAEPAFLVPGMTPEDAASLGRAFDQEAVITHEGWHRLGDDAKFPARAVGFDQTLSDNYSVIEFPGAGPVKYTLDFPEEAYAPAQPGTSAAPSAPASARPRVEDAMTGTEAPLPLRQGSTPDPTLDAMARVRDARAATAAAEGRPSGRASEVLDESPSPASAERASGPDQLGPGSENPSSSQLSTSTGGKQGPRTHEEISARQKQRVMKLRQEHGLLPVDPTNVAAQNKIRQLIDTDPEYRALQKQSDDLALQEEWADFDAANEAGERVSIFEEPSEPRPAGPRLAGLKGTKGGGGSSALMFAGPAALGLDDGDENTNWDRYGRIALGLAGAAGLGASIRTTPLTSEMDAVRRGAAALLLGGPKRLKAELGEHATSKIVKGARHMLKTHVERAKLPNTNKLLKLMKAGAADHTWYDKTGDEIRKQFGEDAELFLYFISATSNNATIPSNTTQALKAYWQHKSGQPFEGFMGAVKGNLERAVNGELRGRKVDNFVKALLGDENAVVVDIWMMRAFGFKGDSPTDNQYDFIENVVKQLAAEHKQTPRQVQASIWFAVKNKAEAGKNRPASPPYEIAVKEAIGRRHVEALRENRKFDKERSKGGFLPFGGSQ